MNVRRSIAKWFAVKFLFRGVPEGRLIVERFFDIYSEAKTDRERLIRSSYSSMRQDEKTEMRYILGVRSRAMFPVSLQTASIAMCNGVHDEDLIDIVVNQMLAYGEATLIDDYHDEVLVPFLSERENLNHESLYDLIREPTKLKEVASNTDVLRNKNIKVFPRQLLGAALRQTDLYRERMLSRPKAYETYLKARDELYKIQALSLLISIALKRDRIETVLKLLEAGKPEYVKNVVTLGNKLALIGQENAAIVFESTQPEDIERKKAELMKENLRLFYHGSTLLKQFTEDDSLKLRTDIENKADNLWALLALQNSRQLNVESVKGYLSRNQHIVSEVLIPCIIEMRDAYHKLEELEFCVSDLKLAIGLVTRQAERDMNKFEKTLNIQLDKEWLSEARELREYAMKG
jgi:hypothetical protein